MKKKLKNIISAFIIIILFGMAVLPIIGNNSSIFSIDKSEVYEGTTSNTLTVGTYNASDGTTIVVGEDGKAKLNGTTALTVKSSNTGYSLTGTGGPYYQLSSTTIVKSPTTAGGARVAYSLSGYTPVEDQTGAYEVWTNGSKVNTYKDLQSAVTAASNGSTIKITKDVDATGGAYVVGKSLTIDGGNHKINAATWLNGLFFVENNATLAINNLTIDGGATGFEVDYDGVTYTDYTIPLVKGSDASDPKTVQSTIISKGNIITNNLTVQNVYSTTNGSVLYALNGNVTVNNSSFIHNNAVNWGGAFLIGSNITDTTNTKAYPVNTVVINNCDFDKNYAKHGGAIYAFNTTKIDIKDSSYTNNAGNTGKGGALCLATQNTTQPIGETLGLDFMQTHIDNTTFDNNWVGNDGFAVQSYDSDLYMTNCTVTSNKGIHPTSSVGTVSVESYRKNSRIYYSATNCTFEDNTGPASVFGDHSSLIDVDFKNCTFAGNTGNESILLYSSTSTFTDCEFIGENVSTTVLDARIYENLEVPPLMTLTNTTIEETNGPTDILVRKQKHNQELNDYTIVLAGTTSGDITIWDTNEVQVTGTHTGDVTTDALTSKENVTVKTNAKLVGDITTNPDSYSISITYPVGNGVYEGEIIYLEKDKKYTESDIYLMVRADKEGYKLKLYTDSACKTEWDYTATADMSLYGAWVEHTHVYPTTMTGYDGGFYYQCECGHLGTPIIAISIDDEIAYDGKIKEVTLVNPNNFKKDQYEIKYYKAQSDGTWALLKTAPKEPGKYKAKLTYDDESTETLFEILEGVKNPETSSNSILIIAIIIAALLSLVGLKQLSINFKKTRKQN